MIMSLFFTFSDLPPVVTGVGVVVFIVLGILYLKMTKKELASDEQPVAAPVNNKVPQPVAPVVVAPSVTEEGLSDEVIAVITAAIAASMQSSTSRIVIKNIKPVQPAPSVWNMLGRTDVVNSRF